MTRHTIRWTKRALRRLDEIGAYIAQDSPAASARVVARIVLAADALVEHPGLGRPGRLTGSRELAFSDIPYIIPYRVTRHDIEILTVMHTSQQWPRKL